MMTRHYLVSNACHTTRSNPIRYTHYVFTATCSSFNRTDLQNSIIRISQSHDKSFLILDTTSPHTTKISGGICKS